MSTYEKMNQMIDLSVLVYKRVIRLYFFYEKTFQNKVGEWSVVKKFQSLLDLSVHN